MSDKKPDAQAKRRGGPSGAHRNPQRLLSQEPEDWAAQDAAAVREGISWAEWARRKLRKGLRP